MLLPIPTSPATDRDAASAAQGLAPRTPFIAHFLPSLTDLAFVMPLGFVFGKLDGTRSLLGDGDTGWHVRTGQWILANHRIPTADIFSFSKSGAPWFAWEWLWDVIFALLHQRWGMAAVVLGSMMVICITSMLFFRLVRRKCENGLVAIAVTLLATGGLAIHWLARPHLFTLLFLIITLHITDRFAAARTKLLACLVPLALLWTNIHGGFFTLFLVLGCYMASDLLNAAIERNPKTRRDFIQSAKTWIVVSGCCFAATFVNPYGWQLHKHILEYLGDSYAMQHIAEFQSINFHLPVGHYTEPLMILSVLVALWDARHRRFAEVLLTLGWLHLALMAQRNLPIFALVAGPSVARGIVAAIRAAGRPEIRSSLASWVSRLAINFQVSSAEVEKNDRIPRFYLASALPLAFIGAILLATPAAPGAVNSKFTSTYDPNLYPEAALAQLRLPETKRIFTDDEWGDYLIYRLYPVKKVFIDGRSDFYGPRFGERYLDLMTVQPGWSKTLDEYSIDTIVIASRFALAQTLKISPDWRVVYDDKVAIVFRRSGVSASFASSRDGKERDRAITQPFTSDHAITEPTTNKEDQHK